MIPPSNTLQLLYQGVLRYYNISIQSVLTHWTHDEV
jgi:hypothetical protein